MLRLKKLEKLGNMPKVPQPKGSSKGRKKLITIVGVVLLIGLAAGAGIFFRWQQSQNPNGSKDDGSSSSSTSSGDLDGLSQNPFPTSVKEAQNLANNGNTAESNKQISAGIASTSDNDEKYELYLQQGVNNENDEKWDDAIASYKSAEAIKKTATVYIGLGRCYEAKGDKQTAVNYYKQSIPLLDSNDPMYEADKRRIEDKVKAFGG